MNLNYTDKNGLTRAFGRIKGLGTIIKITADNVRIYNLEPGIYLLPAGCKIYYKGATETSYRTINPKAFLIVTEHPTYCKAFYMFAGTVGTQSIYHGYSDKTTGTFDRFELTDTIQNSEILQKQADMIIEAGTTITNGYSITLPITYTVGRNNLELYWNGQRLIPKTSSNTDGHYQEVGSTGSSSSTITIYRTSADGDYTLTEDVHLHVVVKGKTIS